MDHAFLSHAKENAIRNQIGAVDAPKGGLRPVKDIKAVIDSLHMDQPNRLMMSEFQCDVDCRQNRACSTKEACKRVPEDIKISNPELTEEGGRFHHAFVPGFCDLVNDTYRMAGDLSILSESYRESCDARVRFLKRVAANRSGVHNGDLQRSLTHTNYMRVEFKDVVMFHPTAWGFPDADTRCHVSKRGVRDPLEGWLHASPNFEIEEEMTQATYSYTRMTKGLPRITLTQLSSGETPHWLTGLSHLNADTSTVDRLAARMGVKWDLRWFLESGLIDQTKVYWSIDAIGNPRLVEPDCLENEASGLNLKIEGNIGFTHGLGSQVRERVCVTPPEVENIAFQIGVYGEYHYYWISIFIAHLPLSSTWVSEIIRGNRTYVNLLTGKRQHIHPYQLEFLSMAESLHMAQIVWDSRGVVNIPCDDCGAPDSLLFCLECTGFMCCDCFVSMHATRKTHLCYPYAGCRYLTVDEVQTLEPLLHLTNIGFCNRRRFLARSNQSDKTGACQCEWMHFDSIDALKTISAFLEEDVERRLVRSVESGHGFFFNFADGRATTDPHEFLSESKKLQSMTLRIQSWYRGTRARNQLIKSHVAAVTIQKNFRMIVQRRRDNLRRSHGPLHSWLERLHLVSQRVKILRGVTRMQALVRGKRVFENFIQQKTSVIRIQALWRGVQVREALTLAHRAALRIQTAWRGFWYGTRRLSRMHSAASKIQAVIRGCSYRELRKLEASSAKRIQALMRGYMARTRFHVRQGAAERIQTWWRRFLEIVQFKFDCYQSLHAIMKDFDDGKRLRAMSNASIHVQRHFRGYRQRKRFERMKKSLPKLDRTVSVVLSPFIIAISCLHSPVHYWFRYLPTQIAERLEALKGVIQLGTCHAGPALSLHLIQKVLAQSSPSEADRKAIIDRVRQTLAHTFARVAGGINGPPRRTAQVGTGLVPCRKDESLLRFQQVIKDMSLRFEGSLRLEEVPFGIHALVVGSDYALNSWKESVLSNLILVPLREFVGQARLVLDSRLAFQGLDSLATAQAMDVVGFEFEVDFPDMNVSTHSTCGDIVSSVSTWLTKTCEKPLTWDRSRVLLQNTDFHFFTRAQVYRALKEIGSGLRTIHDSSLFARHSAEIDSILADAKMSLDRDHYALVVSIVLIHWCIRAMLLRKLWERSAQIIQVKYRYYKSCILARRLTAPVITIQRHWRGLRTAVALFRRDRSATVIQRNYRIVRSHRRSEILKNGITQLQAFWRGSIQRKWIQGIIRNVIRIQRVFRGHLVRLYLGSDEGRIQLRDFRKKSLKDSDEARQSRIIAFREELEDKKRTALKSMRSRARIIQRKVDQYRKAIIQANKTRRPEAVVRMSVFEPIVFAERRVKRTMGQPEDTGPSEIVLAADSLINTLILSLP